MNHDDSALAERLGTAGEAGLYALAPTEQERVEACANALGFAVRRVDLAGCTGKADFLDRVAGTLRFPDWFGRNWDALADCLADMSWLPAAGYVIMLANADDFSAVAATEFDTALQVLEDAARQQAAQAVPMWIFVSRHNGGQDGLRRL